LWNGRNARWLWFDGDSAYHIDAGSVGHQPRPNTDADPDDNAIADPQTTGDAGTEGSTENDSESRYDASLAIWPELECQTDVGSGRRAVGSGNCCPTHVGHRPRAVLIELPVGT
jgi:hypothetical protein